MQTRQKLRKSLLLISFLFFPITLYYLSPVLALHGAYLGIFAGCLGFFSLLFIASLLVGRSYCGWLCPAGGLQECCKNAVTKKAPGGRYNWLKYFIWTPWVATIVFFAIKAGGFHQVDFLFQTYHGISVAEPHIYIIYYGVIALIVLPALLAGRMAFCHYICWMAPFMIIGTKLKNLIGIPSLHLRSQKELCVSCQACNNRCPMSIDVQDMVAKGSMANPECILCGECIDTCPKKALRYSFGNPK